MSTPIEKLEKTIHRREAALRTREAETASREAELEQLKQSLEILECARDDIRGAIEDALSPEPTTTIAPTDVLDIALEGSNNANGPFASGNITVEEAIKLALTSIKSDLGPEGLVKMIIKTAVDVSQLGAEAVIKVALESVRTSDLETSDIVRTALQTARGSKYMFASDIITPAVITAIKLGIEPTVIVKEAFITAMRAEPTRLRTGVLTTLGCAVGMGMSSNGIKGIMDGFAKEVENREMRSASRAAIGGHPASTVISTPQKPNPMQSNPSQPSIHTGAASSTVNPAVIAAIPQPGQTTSLQQLRAIVADFTKKQQIYLSAQGVEPQQIATVNRHQAALLHAIGIEPDVGPQAPPPKRSAPEDSQDQTTGARASKVVKLNYPPPNRQDRPQ